MPKSKEEIAAAFTEWERRFREEPSRFISETERLATTEKTYGEMCAEYFLQVLAETSGK